ncbi:N-acetylmuramoyl-L-alanine amidase [Microbispora sp. RL4-1S]|uniref:N-acetylmuramoyl-L-alanine amidase n=1 Tax=Microbispora oryzae TaxID=2806554 RepID=A0A940WL95_9ACTN|nr:peptidoglycan recognition family protein [Microbispora oryzae]MBP2703545.1 N-acetylmuramoyl-L-alanine amidase [Microbispora oryzae]
MQLETRAEWGARPPKGAYDAVSSPRGVKVHYTGGRVDPGIVGDHELCELLQRSFQRQHMIENGWLDLGYTATACVHGRVMVGRGPGHLPAANGAGLNSSHYAVLCLVGNAGLVEPPDELLAGLADAIRWLRREGGAGPEIKGHRDGYATDCPGDPLYKIVKRWGRDGLPGSSASSASSDPPPFRRVLSYPPLMEGDDVRQWQRQMRRRGWAIDDDGLYGPASAAVAAEFARRKDLPGGGRVTRAVWDAAWELPVT